jgi:hypothetical protein
MGASGLLVAPGQPLPAQAHARYYAYQPAFFPSAQVVAHAVPVRISYGDDRGGINLRLTAVPAATISGALVGPPEAIIHVPVRLFARDPLTGEASGPPAASTTSSPTGEFRLAGIVAGAYRLEVRPSHGDLVLTASGPGTVAAEVPWSQLERGARGSLPAASAPPRVSYSFVRGTSTGSKYWGTASIDVAGEDIMSLDIPMSAAAIVKGRITFDSGTPTSGVLRLGMLVTAEPVDGRGVTGIASGRSVPDASGHAFVLDDLVPGRYHLRLLTTDGWVVKSMTCSGRDCSDEPIEIRAGQDTLDVGITVTQVLARVAGTVRDAQRRPVADATVIAFPAEPHRWTNYGLNPPRIKSTLSAQSGTYGFGTLPAGRYFLIALDPSGPDRPLTPGFLRTAASLSAPVQLEWGRVATQDLVVQEVK